MKKKLPPTFTYDEVATIFKANRGTIYNKVGDEAAKKPLVRVGHKSGYRPTITSESVLKEFMKKEGVDEAEAVKRIQERLHPEKPSEETKADGAKEKEATEKGVKSAGEPKSSSVASPEKERPDGAPEASGERGTPATPESPSVIYTGSSGVKGKKQKDSTDVEKEDEEEASRTYDIWMYTIPFYDRNPEFHVPPEEVMKLGTTEDYSRRLDFIADSFMEVRDRNGKKQVEAVVVSFCKSKGDDQPSAAEESSPTQEQERKKGYYHFHALVVFNLKLQRGTAKNKFGDSARLDPVKHGHLKPSGKFVPYRNPVQGCLDYINANGRFEGEKTERCIGHTARGIEKLQSIVKAEKKAAEGKTPKTIQVVTAARSGESRKDILAANPTYINPTGIETIRFTQQYEAWKAMGCPKTRDVRVMLVLGDVRTGKTHSINENMGKTKLGMATFAEATGLEAYEAQAVLQVDHPHPRWCPPDMLEKLLSRNIVQLPVRKEGGVLTLWKAVFVEAKSIRGLESDYGRTAVRDMLKYVNVVRYCFHVETRDQRIAFPQDGYAMEANQGVNTKLDYFDIPVTRGLFRTHLGDTDVDDELVRKLARMYFDIMRYGAESSPELVDIMESEEDIDLAKYTASILQKEYGPVGREEVLEAYMTACERKARRRNDGRAPEDGRER